MRGIWILDTGYWVLDPGLFLPGQVFEIGYLILDIREWIILEEIEMVRRWKY